MLQFFLKRIKGIPLSLPAAVAEAGKKLKERG